MCHFPRILISASGPQTPGKVLPKKGELKHLEEDPPALVKSSDDFSLDRHCVCSIMREPEPEPLRLVAPKSLTQRNHEIINVNCFRTLKKIL